MLSRKRTFRSCLSDKLRVAAGAAAVVLLAAPALTSHAQAPYLLPYTINTIAGGGTAPAKNTSCKGALGTSGNAGTSYDALGDVCLANGGSVVLGTDVHDVGVDSQGNVIIVDNESTALIRRVDARSGLISVAGGNSTSQKICTSAVDKYGDGCPASDGLANAANGYTLFGKAIRGIGVAKNGDIYIADYSDNVVHKISATTGMMSLVAGYIPTYSSTASATSGYTGNGGPATSAEVASPRGVAADANGNVFIADTSNDVVRVVYAGGTNVASLISQTSGMTATPGNIYTIAGKAGTTGFTGDQGVATSATVGAPEDVKVDSNGNVFIADFSNAAVRVVYEGGTTVKNLIALTNNGAVAVPGNIYTIAGIPGNSSSTYTGTSPVRATSIILNGVRKIAIDSHDNVFIADSGYDVVWFLDASTGYIRIIAGSYGLISGGAGCGNGSSIGDGCKATLATISPNSAMGDDVDDFGNLYVTDPSDNRVRKVSVNSAFPAVNTGSSVTQTMLVHFAAGDTLASSSPLTVTGSTAFTVVPGACTIQPDGTSDCVLTATFAPTTPGNLSASLLIKSASGLSSNIALTGTGTGAALSLDPGSATLVGSGFKNASGVAMDSLGNVFVADAGNDVVMEYPVGGSPITIAGTAGTAGSSGDNGPAASALLSAPTALAIAPDGTIYIADSGNNRVRAITPATGIITTVAGAGTACTNAIDTLGDGCLGTQATLANPSGLAVNASGNLFISDTGNNVVRELTRTGYIFKIGQTLDAPAGLQVDIYNNLYVADTGTSTIKELASTGVTTVIAGNGQVGASGNGGPATSASLGNAAGVALDAAGNVYIADTGNHVVRIVNASGTRDINTVTGVLGVSGTSTLPSTGDAVLLNSPASVAATGSGALYIVDSGNSRVLALNRSSIALNFGIVNVGATSPARNVQETSSGTVAATLPQTLFAATGNSSVFSLTAQGSNGCTGGQVLTAGTICGLAATFAPPAIGNYTAAFTQSGVTPTLPSTPVITASGEGVILTNTSSASVVTNPASGNPQYSVPFTVQTTVTPAQCSSQAPSCIPTGTVQFYVGTTAVGTPVALNSQGIASINIGGQNVGTVAVTAVYSGDSFYASSTAPTLNVTVVTGTSSTAVGLSASSVPQFQPLTINATITSPSGGVPTGTVTFFADGVAIGTAALNAQGVASITAPQLTDPLTGNPYTSPQYSSFGLTAGAHKITAQYSGDANYSASTSPASTLTIQADAQSFQSFFVVTTSTGVQEVPTVTIGTAQGSTAVATVYINPTNTLSGNITASCSGLPAGSTCTVSPTTLTFTPVAGQSTPMPLTVTFWTDVSPGVIPKSNMSKSRISGVLGWPMLLFSLAIMLGLRGRQRRFSGISLLLLCGLAIGASSVLTGCTENTQLPAPTITPVGAYNVTLTINGPNSMVQTLPVLFNVGQGAANEQ